MLAAACAELGLELAVRGARTEPSDGPAALMLDADVVVGYGRCIVEAMACGRAAYVWDHMGGDGWVTAASYAALEADGFGGRATGAGVDAARLVADLAAYDPAMGVVNRDIADPRARAAAARAGARGAAARGGRTRRRAPAAGRARTAGPRGLGPRAPGHGLVAPGRDRGGGPPRGGRGPGRGAAAGPCRRGGRRGGGGGGAGPRRCRRAGADGRPGERGRAEVDAPLPHGGGARPTARPRAEGRAPGRAGQRRAGGGPRPRPRRPGRFHRRGPRSSPSSSSPTAPSRARPRGPLRAGPGRPGRAARRELGAAATPRDCSPRRASGRAGGRAPGAPLPRRRVQRRAARDGRPVHGLRRRRPRAAAGLGRRPAAPPPRRGARGGGRARAVEPAGAAGRLPYLLLNHRRTPWTPVRRGAALQPLLRPPAVRPLRDFREDMRVGEDLDLQRRFGPDVAIEFAPGRPGRPPRTRTASRRCSATSSRAAAAWPTCARGPRGRTGDRRSPATRCATPGSARAPGWPAPTAPRQLAQVAAAAPLLAPGAAAYAVGALTAPLEPPGRAPPPPGAATRAADRALSVQGRAPLPAGPVREPRAARRRHRRARRRLHRRLARTTSPAGRSCSSCCPAARGVGRAGNRERLIRAAWEHGADWLYGIDADERVERHFRAPRRARSSTGADAGGAGRATRAPARAVGRPGPHARRRGVGAEAQGGLFRARARPRLRPAGTARPLGAAQRPGPTVASRSPTCSSTTCGGPSGRPRDAPGRRYEALDPEARWQSIGYAYLT